MGFDIVVMDYSRDGTEAGDYRFYWRDDWRENPEWRGNYTVRYWVEEVIPQNGEGVLKHAPHLLNRVSGWALETSFTVWWLEDFGGRIFP